MSWVYLSPVWVVLGYLILWITFELDLVNLPNGVLPAYFHDVSVKFKLFLNGSGVSGAHKVGFVVFICLLLMSFFALLALPSRELYVLFDDDLKRRTIGSLSPDNRDLFERLISRQELLRRVCIFLAMEVVWFGVIVFLYGYLIELRADALELKIPSVLMVFLR